MFDAELYLRLAGERQLGSNHDDSGLNVAAQALVAVGCIDEGAARAVIEDYQRANAVRMGDGYYPDYEEMRASMPPVAPLPPRRVVHCDDEITAASGKLRVRHMTLSSDGVKISATLEMTGARRRGAQHMMFNPPTLTVGDDRGNSEQAFFSGGSGGALWEGTFVANGLAPDTAYIEVEGHRIDVGEPPAPVEIRIEPLPEEDPALRFVYGRVFSRDGFHRPWLQAAIDALVAAGALAPDAPELADLRAVMSGQQSKQMPEPWRSLTRRRGRRDGPVGTLVLGAATPIFDGYAVAINALESAASDWSLYVDTAPHDAIPFGFGEGGALPRGLTWWAVDDRDNRYLGQVAEWGGGEAYGSGTLGFDAPLDPRATWLELMPTGQRERAVIRVELAW